MNPVVKRGIELLTIGNVQEVPLFSPICNEFLDLKTAPRTLAEAKRYENIFSYHFNDMPRYTWTARFDRCLTLSRQTLASMEKDEQDRVATEVDRIRTEKAKKSLLLVQLKQRLEAGKIQHDAAQQKLIAEELAAAKKAAEDAERARLAGAAAAAQRALSRSESLQDLRRMMKYN